jgi:hypothetical protein
MIMQNLSSFEGARAPASREAHPAVVTAAHSLPPRPSSSPAEVKPEAQCFNAPAAGPVRPSPATGTAGAAAPSGSGPQFDRPQFDQHGAGLPVRSCIRTEDGTVILFDRPTGRAVSAPDRKTAEARLSRLAQTAGL